VTDIGGTGVNHWSARRHLSTVTAWIPTGLARRCGQAPEPRQRCAEGAGLDGTAHRQANLLKPTRPPERWRTAAGLVTLPSCGMLPVRPWKRKSTGSGGSSGYPAEETVRQAFVGTVHWIGREQR
jgi:hypothetical protein